MQEQIKVEMLKWKKLCFSKNVMRRAFLTALVVGTILAIINYADSLLRGTITSAQVTRMLITFLVPYFVSTYSSVSTILSIDQKSSR